MTKLQNQPGGRRDVIGAVAAGTGTVPGHSATRPPSWRSKSFVKGEPVSSFRAGKELRRGILGDVVRARARRPFPI